MWVYLWVWLVALVTLEGRLMCFYLSEGLPEHLKWHLHRLLANEPVRFRTKLDRRMRLYWEFVVGWSLAIMQGMSVLLDIEWVNFLRISVDRNVHGEYFTDPEIYGGARRPVHQRLSSWALPAIWRFWKDLCCSVVHIEWTFRVTGDVSPWCKEFLLLSWNEIREQHLWLLE